MGYTEYVTPGQHGGFSGATETSSRESSVQFGDHVLVGCNLGGSGDLPALVHNVICRTTVLGHALI